MSKFSILLIILFIAGCRELPVEEENTVEVSFLTNRSEYRFGQIIELSLANNTEDSILAYHCVEIDQMVDGAWEFVGYWGGCQSESSRYSVGAGFTQSAQGLGDVYTEGQYRLAVDILLQEDWRQRERIVTRAFKMKR